MNEYKDVLALLQGTQDIDNFVAKSIEFFLKDSDKPEVFVKCMNDNRLSEQIAELAKNAENFDLRNHIQLSYGRTAIKNIFKEIKEIASNYIPDIIAHVMDTPQDALLAKRHCIGSILLRRYQEFLKVHYAFQKI